MKTLKNLNSHEKRQSTEVDNEMTQNLELPSKNFKAAIIKLFEHAIMNTLNTNRKTETLIK